MSAPRPRTILVPLLALLAAALLLAACGSDDSTGATASDTASAPGGASATVALADNAALGTQVLVDADGNTLYLFEKDEGPDESYCSGACAKAWPPLTTDGEATAGDGLEGDLTTLEREDGTTQVAYAGHPLYLYAGDSAPGDANGNGVDQFGAEWYAMDSSGAAVEDGGSGGEETTSTDDSGAAGGSSGGYGY